MIVIVKDPYLDEVFHDDVAAVVWSRGVLRLCRDGNPDQFIDEGVSVTVVNDG